MKKPKRFLKITLIIFFVIIIVMGAIFALIPGPVVWILNARAFEMTSIEVIEKSIYENNGSWWGYNQKKIAVIDHAIFSFDYDNTNFSNGNPSLDNPYYCRFHMTVDGDKTSFDVANAERPCNVVADPANKKVYYFAVEPTGENIGNNGNTGVARTMMYVYQYHDDTQEVTLIKSEEVDPPSMIGKIRQSVDIDDSGNITIAYGEYSGMLTMLVYDVESDIWTKHQTMTNYDQDALMYCYVDMVHTELIHTLCVQDTWTGEATYYQYVKLFVYQAGIWSDHMIVDYRDHPKAAEESEMVEHTAMVRINDELHILTRSKPLKETRHFVYRDGTIQEKEHSLKKNYEWIRLMVVNDTLYYAATHTFPIASLDVIEVESGRIVFRTTGIAMGSYIYVGDPLSTGEIPMLFYPGWGDMMYQQARARRILLKLK